MALENSDKRINIKDLDLSALDKRPNDPPSETDSEFKLKFDGDLNEVNASTLGYSLVNMSTLVSEATREVDTVARVEIKVKATGPGSFEVFLALHSSLEGIFQALGPEGLAKAGAASLWIIKMVAESLKLRKLLKGEPPAKTEQDGDVFQIYASDNARTTVDKRTYNFYFNHPEANEAAANIFKALQSDKSIERFEMLDRNNTSLFEATREDFPQMALSTSVPQPETREIIDNTSVYVVKPSFNRTLKWDVLYHGMRISVKVRDERFLDRVQSGQKFARGDVLVVALRIEQRLDKQLRTYINKKYEILEVKQHVPFEPTVQRDIFQLPPADPPEGGK